MEDGWPDEEFSRAVSKSTSIAGVLRTLGVPCSGWNYRRVHVQVERDGLDISHWLGQAYLRGQSHDFKKSTPLSDILVEYSTYSNGVHLKRRLISAGLLRPECYECGITDWRGKRLALHLDHINGVRNDQRLENLRLLCPNCHSLTETYAGRNARSWRRRGTAVADPKR